MRNISLVSVLALCIALSGCAAGGSPTPPPPPIDVLSAAVTAAEIAEPIIAASVCAGSSGQACLTPLQEQSLMAYMGIVANGLGQVSIIESKTETPVQKALEVTAVIAPIIAAAPVMSNVPPNIRLVVTATIAAVQVVAAVYGAPAGTAAPVVGLSIKTTGDVEASGNTVNGGTIEIESMGKVTGDTPASKKPGKPSKGDLSRLSAIHQRCVALQGKIATAR